MRYFLSAGEASGDIHAAQLIKALKQCDTRAEFAFLGGDLMSEAARRTPVIDYRRMAFMGFSEVLRHLPEIFGNLRIAKRAIAEFRPDALIVVDYPSFNLKLAEYASSLGIPVYYYISPKVWAWKSWRVKQMRRYIRRVLSILPFEEKWFAERGMKVKYVGNPSLEEIEGRIASQPSRDEFCRQWDLNPDRPILGLVPGSRRGEIRCNLPVMKAVAERHSEMQAVVTGAPGIETEIYTSIWPDAKVVSDATTAVMRHAEAALVTSGTATLECALCGTPQVACYRANGVKLSYNIMKHLIKAPFVTLPNLIAGREVIPEMLVHLCTPDSVDSHLSALLDTAGEARAAQLAGYADMRRALGHNAAAETAAAEIVNDLLELKSTNSDKHDN